MPIHGQIDGANLEEGFAWGKPCGHLWRLLPSDTVHNGLRCPICNEINTAHELGITEGIKQAKQLVSTTLNQINDLS